MQDFAVADGLDLGLFSDDPRAVSFYEREVGLPFVETLRHSPTYEERFYSLGGSALKINYSTEPMPAGCSGYRQLTVAQADRDRRLDLVDPDGLRIALVPVVDSKRAPVCITCEVPDVDIQAQFLVLGLGARAEGDHLRVGRTSIELIRSADAQPAAPTWSRGFNYVVAFVDDVLAAHQGLISLGAEHSVPPTRLADRCVFSWLRDPSGNWLELVQPAALASLPDVTPIEQRWKEITVWRETGTAFS